MKKGFLIACMFGMLLFTSCNPQGTSHSNSGSEESPSNDRDTLDEGEGDLKRDTSSLPNQDSAGRVDPQ